MGDESRQGQESPVLFGKGTIAVIAGIVVILVAFLAAGMMPAGQGTVVPPAECSAKTIAYVNNNLVSGSSPVSPVSVSESRGLYEIRALFQSEEIVLYTTKDCTLLFTSVVNMSGSTASQQAAETPAPVKSARPVVDLYVMSFCPYGTQAETVMKPVVDLLGSLADIRIRYITTVTGSTADSVSSLHGAPEANEDLQQACINRYYPEKLWAYLTTFNEACYPSWQDASALASCRENVTASLGIDKGKIDTCAGGGEGISLLVADEAASERDSATASPMLFINGVKYSGARTPEAFKQAICNSYETVPAECSTVLSSTSGSASGGCG
jgi:hypothetical protein